MQSKYSKTAIVVVAWFSLSCPSTAQHPLSSSALDWELVPAGYLEPRATGTLSLDDLAEQFDDLALAEATRDKDCFALAYVVLLRKKSLAESLPARRKLDESAAWYGDLRVRVLYGTGKNGFSKVISYPEAEKQQQIIINSARGLVGAVPKQDERSPTEPDPPRVVRALPNESDTIEPFVRFVSMSPQLAVDGNSSWRTIGGSSDLVRALASRSDWQGIHVALTQKFFPEKQRSEATPSGFIVNCNGLTAKLVKASDGWEISYPCEDSEQPQLTEFWSMRMVGRSGRTWKQEALPSLGLEERTCTIDGEEQQPP